tara:strand:- start:37 stop:531 length:495 start_codon:yes stop_codon:yes gene_type:complete
MDILDMMVDGPILDEKRYLGKEQKNWVRRFPDAAQEYMNKHMPYFKGRWDFEFFHSDVHVSYHTDTILGNDGDIGFILPLDWEGHKPATIMYNWWSDRRVMFAGNGEIRYADNNELALLVREIPSVDFTFEWDKQKALIFDCKQLHSARAFKDSWKEFIIGFVV